MKSLTNILYLFTLTFFAVDAYGQNLHTDLANIKIDSIRNLSFMEGTWIGDGWIIMGKDKKEFIQTESVIPKVNNTILVIEGIGLSKDTAMLQRQVIHDAFGIIFYDKVNDRLVMTSFASTGGKTETELTFIGEKRFQWQFNAENGGTVRFTDDFSITGEWLEVGEFSYTQGQWHKFFEMKLTRQ